MKLKGVVEVIIYRNDSNGYTVAKIKLDENDENNESYYSDKRGFFSESDVAIVGYLPFVNKGDMLIVTGNTVTHPDYGEQFKVISFEKVMPETLDALEKYLGNGLIKGVGAATAKKIVKKFKKDTVRVIRNEPERLAEIKGITKEKALEISESFIENWNLWQIVGFLERFGIGAQSAQNIFKKLGSDAIEKIKEDPYILEETGVKCDFSQVDRMALSIGIEKSSIRRIEAGIIHALNLATFNGHSCVLKTSLIQYVATLLGVSEEDVSNGIIDLKAKEKIMTENRKEMVTVDDKTEMRVQKWVYLIDYYRAEMNIANKLKSLQDSDNLKHILNLEKMLKNTTDIELSEKQFEALKIINENNVTIITGGPGTGKTTIIKTIIEMYKGLGKKTVLCAPTGRAAKRMTEATGEEAKTLHRLLEIGKIVDDRPNANIDVEPIDADIVIIDEMSMVDLFLMNYLLNGIFKGTKLILVGDSDQLQSVGPGRVLKDLIESNKIPFITLNKIFRQAAKSKIIVNAHKVNDGINFINNTDEDDKNSIDDFYFISEDNVSKIQEMCVDSYNKNVQVITPTKKGELGTKTLNKILQARYNKENKNKNEKKFGDVIFREGDKVMQTKNNYDIEWMKDSNSRNTLKREYGSGIFNGEMGTIEEIDKIDETILIKFEDGKKAVYGYQDLEQIEHSYAITVHKSQGSEFDEVIMPILGVSKMLLTRNVLYTGMTRAKNKLIIMSNEPTIDFMINNVNSKVRNSGLSFKIKEVFNK